MQTRRIDIGALELEIAEDGVGGRPLLLMHGFTGAKEDFADWIEPLAAAGWHVVAPDNRGHGDSDKPAREDAYDLQQFADDTVALADAVGFERFTILGHSMGGMFTQVVAIQHGHRIDALILMDTHHGSLRTIDPDLLALGISASLEHGMDLVADVIAMGDEEADPLASEAHLRLIRERPERKVQSDRNLRVCSPYMYASCLRQIADQEDRLPSLADLAMPTLVIVGEQDTPFLKASARMAETIPDARLAVIPDAGHSPQLEAPAAWWAAMSGFLADAVAAEVP
jgi:pimeloyl-ACP methyl ester carboxylesterase